MFWKIEKTGYPTRWLTGPETEKDAEKTFLDSLKPRGSRNTHDSEIQELTEIDFRKQTKGFSPHPNNGEIPQIIDTNPKAKPKGRTKKNAETEVSA